MKLIRRASIQEDVVMFFPGCNLPFAIDEEDRGYIVLADYGRFKGSRASNVEVHGGASLEEVIVPIITFLLMIAALLLQLLNGEKIKAVIKREHCKPVS